MPFPYSTPPTFYNGTSLGAPDLGLIHNDLITLDGMVRRGRRGFVSHSRNMSAWTYDGNGMGAYKRIWYGGFQFRTGMTTATYVIDATLAGGEILRITHDGTQVYSGALAAGTSTVNVPLSGLTDAQIVSVELQIDWPGAAPSNHGDASYWVMDAYVSPVGASLGSYPGVSTFSTSSDELDAARGNQLSNSIDWLFNRMAAVPIPLQTSNIYQTSNDFFLSGGGLNVMTLWAGSISRDSLNTHLSATLGYIAGNSPVVEGRLYVNEALVDSVTITPGARGAKVFNYDMSSFSNGSVRKVRLASVATTPFAGQGRVSTRYSVIDVQVQDGLTMSTPLSSYTAMQSLTWTNVATTLNAIGSRITNIKSILDTNTDVWSKARMFTGRLNAPIESMSQAVAPIFVPRTNRVGDVLWVKGKNVKLGYGAMTVEPDANPDKPNVNRTYKWKTAYEHDIISGDAVQTTAVYLDTLPGLYRGTPYYLFGDVNGAFEYISGF